jgi:hypothetical protein
MSDVIVVTLGYVIFVMPSLPPPHKSYKTVIPITSKTENGATL